MEIWFYFGEQNPQLIYANTVQLFEWVVIKCDLV